MQRLLLGLAGIAVGIYYRRERLGRRVPPAGPVLLVGNHPNGLVDPVLLAGTTDRPVRFLGKAPLFELPVLGAVMRGLEALPIYRAQDDADTALNERTFEAVFGALAADELVCLFPEGRSHDAPTLQRLKTGAARMALGAESSAGFSLGVRIVPVGLVYRAKRRFRSRAATWVGDAIEVRDLEELHRRDERAAVRALTERIAAGLASVTLELDRWEDLPLLELAGRISGDRGANPLQRVQRFARGVRELREENPERIEDLAERIGAFRERLHLLGVDLEHLDVRYRTATVLRYAARKLALLAVGLPLALAGTVFWAVPYAIVPRIPRRMGTSRDIHATVQILAGLVLFPVWGLALSALVWLRFGPLAGLALLLALLPLFLAALWMRDFGQATLADVAAFRRLAPRRALQHELRAERNAIAAEIEAVARELGPR